MPRKGNKRRGVRATRVKATITLGTLAADTLLSANLCTGPDEKIFLISADLVWAMRGHTAGEGPISLGLAHGDYTDAEKEAWLESQAGFDTGDLVSQEVNRRKCREVGSFDGQATTEKLNLGTKVRTPLRFALEEGKNLDIWAYNEGAQLTTGTVVEVSGKIYWR